MFSTIAECRDEYIKHLGEYLEWLMERKLFYSAAHKKEAQDVPEDMFSCNDYRVFKNWESRIEYAQKILGITIEENKKIIEEIEKEMADSQ